MTRPLRPGQTRGSSLRGHRARRDVLLATSAALVVLLSACGALVGVGPAPSATSGAVLEPSRAQAIATRVLTAATAATATTGAAAATALPQAFTGTALAEARAEVRLAAVTSAATRANRALTSAPPAVLAVSRDPAYPRSMVVQATLQASGLPVLFLLTTPDVRTPYRIASSAPMLPGSQVPGFDTLAAGSPALGTSPTYNTLGTAYAASLAYPAAKAPAGITPGDAFSAAIKSNAAKQNAALAGIGSYRQRHALQAVTGGLRTAGGVGALVFLTLDRSDTFVVSRGTLSITPAFTALSGLKSVSAEADLSTLETVILVVPASGSALVVGGDEHLYAARGV